MHFGISYVGIIYLLMLFVPNILWSKNQPENYEKYVINESKILLGFEKIGRILVCCFVLIFSDFNINSISLWSLRLFASFFLMILYECFWVRYFKSARTMQDFYSSIIGIPVAGATLPVCAFFFLGVYGVNFPLVIATIILGIGHIGIHLNHLSEVSGTKVKTNILRAVLKGTGVTIIAIILIISVSIIGLKNITYLINYIDTNKGVDEGVYVTLGGQEQYLLIRGKDTHNPVIIWLHGGPSSPDSFISYSFSNLLVDEYTIVCWDQRGCGRTFFKNKDIDPNNETATFEQALTDLDELLDYVGRRFESEEVVIVGHSYGTMLGSKYSLEHPEKVAAYIGVSQVVNLESDIYSYKDALTIAEERGDDTTDMQEAYEKYMSDKSIVNMINLRSYVTPYHPAEKEADTIWLGLKSPYMGMDDLRWFMKQLGGLEDYVDLNYQLFDYIKFTDVRDYGLEYQMPVGLISGLEDWITPVKYTEDYYNEITAPKKNYSKIEGCGHFPQGGSPEEFSEILKSMLDDYLS